MKKELLTIKLLLLCFFLAGQKPRQVLQQLKDSFPQERLYIHYDKEVYLAGETIWFKVYLLNGFMLSDLSANLMVELINENNKIVLEKKLPVLAGTVVGNFDLPDSLLPGHYIIRAYTPWMLNFDKSFLYHKSIYIYKPVQTESPQQKSNSSYLVNFFPEGGDLVNGVINVMAFNSTDQYGMPLSITGRILDEGGNEQTVFNSIHNGLGKVGFLPKTGSTYQAEISFEDGMVKKFPLPMAKENGWAIQVREESDNQRKIILAKPPAEKNTNLVLIGQMQQELLFEQSVVVQGNNAVVSIDTHLFPTGILQLTLLTNAGVPMAERLLFINNNDYLQPLKLVMDTLSVKPKAKNVFSFSLPDSVLGSYSISIVDGGKIIHGDDHEDIVSRLLLTSDLNGYIHNPSYYFSANDKATRSALDLVMMTNGWRRFSWAGVMNNRFPSIHFQDRNHIQFSGTIFSEKTKRPVLGGEANFVLRTKDSLTDFFQVAIGENGKFMLDNLVYTDSAQFSFQFNSKKNREKELSIQLDKDTFNIFYPVSSKDFEGIKINRSFLKIADSLKSLYSVLKDTSGNYRILQSVTVVAKKKKPAEELNKRYATGMFSSTNMVNILDLVNNDPGAGAQNVFQYIQGRIGGIRVVPSGNPPTYNIYTSKARSLMGGPIPVPFYLDESPATSLQLATIPMNQVAMIKFFQTGFMANAGSGVTQALAVYTKKATDTKIFGPGYLNAFMYPGYSVVKEFYSPDYEENPSSKEMPDRRTTLLWQPDLKPDPETGKYIIRFFNNDSAKQLKLVLEGVTSEGKLVREVKLF